MGGMNNGSGWIQRVVAPWSYRDGNVLNAVVDPLNLTNWDEGKVANMGKGSKDIEIPVAEPIMPTAAETSAKAQATAQAAARDKLKRASRSRSIFSSPLGIANEASTIKKTLLGQ